MPSWQHETPGGGGGGSEATTVSDTASLDLTLTGTTISGVVLPAGVDHNSLANLTVGDPHTQYLLESATTAFSLTLLDDANAAAARTTLGLGTAATKDYTETGEASKLVAVTSGGRLRLTDSKTLDTDDSGGSLLEYLNAIGDGKTITADNLLSPIFFRLSSTVLVVSPNPFSGGRSFENSTVFRNPNGVVKDLSHQTGFYNAPSFIGDGAQLQTDHSGFLDSAGYTVANAGTIDAQSHTSFDSRNVVVGSGATMVERRGLRVEDVTGAGSVTNNTAIDIAALTKGGTLNLSLRSAGASTQMRHAGPAVFAANAAPANSSVGLEVQSTTKALLPSRMTTGQRDALTALDGMVLYNSTTAKLQARANGAWRDLTEPAIDHGALTGLTDDDHSIYALLAGRSGGQTLIGGTASGDDLTLQSTSHATFGHVRTATPHSLFLWDSAVTITTAPGAAIEIGTDHAITYDFATGAAIGLRFKPTITFEQNPSAFGSMFLFAAQATIKNPAAEARNWSIAQTFLDGTVWQGDTAASTNLSHRSFTAGPVFETVNGGTLAVPDIQGLYSGATVNAGVTVTARRGVLIDPWTGAGTVTTEVGADINVTENQQLIRMSRGTAVKPQTVIRQQDGTTSGAGSVTFDFPVPATGAQFYQFHTLGHQTNGVEEVNVYEDLGKAKNNGGTVTWTGIAQRASEEIAGWSVSVAASGTNIRVTCNGAAGDDITWVCNAYIVEDTT